MTLESKETLPLEAKTDVNILETKMEVNFLQTGHHPLSLFPLSGSVTSLTTQLSSVRSVQIDISEVVSRSPQETRLQKCMKDLTEENYCAVIHRKE